MDSIPPQPKLTKTLGQRLHAVVREVGFKERLPWELQRLRERGWQRLDEAGQEILSKSKSLGVLPEQVAGQYVYHAATTAAKRLKADASSEKSLPTEEQMEDALKVFSTEEWNILIEDFEQREADALQSYIDSEEQYKRYERLKREIGTKKLHAILTAARLRDVELWLSENRTKLVTITDPYWACVWKENADALNTLGKGHASKGKSLAESVSARNTAKRLTKRDEIADHDMPVSAYQVDKWWERVKELPFEEFDGDWLSYWTTIRNTAKYNSYLHSKGKKNK